MVTYRRPWPIVMATNAAEAYDGLVCGLLGRVSCGALAEKEWDSKDGVVTHTGVGLLGGPADVGAMRSGNASICQAPFTDVLAFLS